MKRLAMACFIIFSLASVSAQTLYHVDLYQTSLSRPADEALFYSPIRFTVDTTTDLHMRWIKVQRIIPRSWEANVSTFDSLFTETADSGDFMLRTDTTAPNLLETVFKPHGQQGQCMVEIKVFPINDPSQEAELTFEAFGTAPTGIAATAKPLSVIVHSVGNSSLYLGAPADTYPLQAELYDMDGRMIASYDLFQPQVIVTDITGGIYVMLLRFSSGEVYSRKLLIE
jgi:hypothetical protein